MPEAAVQPLEQARSLARTASGLAIVAMIIIIVTTAIRDFAMPAIAGFMEARANGGAEGGLAILKGFAIGALSAAPNFLLVQALSQLQTVLREYQAGNFFTPRAAHAVRKTGEAILWALAVKIAVTPTIVGFISGSADGPRLAFETFDLGLIALALFVLLMGRVLEGAVAIKADNDQII